MCLQRIPSTESLMSAHPPPLLNEGELFPLELNEEPSVVRVMAEKDQQDSLSWGKVFSA